jgi:predicted transcriptional regulator
MLINIINFLGRCIMQEEILSVTQAARLLNVSEQTVRDYTKKKLLKDRRDINGWRFFLREEIEGFRKRLIGEEGSGDE